MSKRKKLYFPPLTVGIFVVCAVVVTALITNAVHTYQPKKKPPTDEELYEAAVLDSMLMGEDDIQPLVKLNDKKMIDTDDVGKVLLVTWHNVSYLYSKVGQPVELTYGPLWAYADGEFAEWYAANKDDIDAADWTLRLEQLLGMPPGSEMTYFSGVWVWPDNVRRPAYTPEPSSPGMSVKFGKVEPKFKEWFGQTLVERYFDGRHTWTRLGYTYDWAPDGGKNGSRYGLTEFIIEENATITAEFTCTTAEFRDWLEERAVKYEE